MIKFYTLVLSFFIIAIGSTSFAQRNCGTTDYTKHQLESNPSLANIYSKQEKAIRHWISNSKVEVDVVYIPVIFHVLYNNNTTNISDAQIMSQIDILNRDYSRQNLDTSNTPDQFNNLGADIRIQFCPAHQTPDGNWTDGITRTSTTKTTFIMSANEAKFNSKGGVDAWNTEKYLNIWIVPEIINAGMTGILGYAQFPGGTKASDGVVVGYKYIGNIGTVHSPFNKGRTLTHEIGHYFSLYHIWGDDFGACTGSDHVNDTPNQASKNFGCPSHPHKSCNNDGDMFQNYMDYTNDACMNLFTLGQKDRMLAALNTSRTSLLTSGMCQANYISKQKDLLFKISPNPASSQLRLILAENSANTEITILDLTGKTVVKQISNENNITINTSELPSGIYFLKVKSDSKIGIKKFIIQQ